MKKNLAMILVCVCVVMCLGGCRKTPGLYVLDDYIPELMDVTTQYPYVEKISVTDCASGNTVEFTDGVTHDIIRMQFEGIQCIREKTGAADYGPLFTVTFYTTDGETTVYVLSKSEYIIGEYLYEAMTAGVDVVFFENLFAA